MRRNTARDWTVEEFEAWAAATEQDEAVAAAADEEGGPRLSLVLTAEREVPWPADLLPPPADPVAVIDAGPGAPPVMAEPFDGLPLDGSRKRLAGWSAERQRVFLAALAETGSVHLASSAARLSARSAYRLRARSAAFAAAWDTAEQLAAGRLAALAFDRAIHGRIEQVWHEGILTAERRVPNDKLLMWLLARLDPKRFAAPWELRGGDSAADPQADARAAFPALLDAVKDAPCE